MGLDSSQFERQLNRVVNKLDSINYEVQRMNQSLGDGDRAGQRLVRNAERLRRAEYEAWWQTQNVNRELQRTNPILSSLFNRANRVGSGFRNWTTFLGQFNGQLNKSNSLTSMLQTKMLRLVNTYLGVMGTKALINTSDNITGAENKLNKVNATALGTSGYDADGGYSQATFTATEEAMDKMYVSAQKVRMGYNDMMSNVSKSMTLANGAFKGNIDNAIRFQEVMAEAYAIGGASAEEMSTSMYQMIQALGAGTLAGDELRSVREGAPLAYQEIEKFVQGVYNTEESLKDLAAQGKVTSDMVVAAVLSAGDEMDKSFAQTAQTFAQTWTQIKNAATYAFKPVSEMLRESLNNAVSNGLIQRVESLFATASKALQITLRLSEKLVNWLVDNWGWLKNVVVGAFIAMMTYQAMKTAVSLACAYVEFRAWMLVNNITWTTIATMIRLTAIIGIVIGAVLALVYVFYLWKTAGIDTCNAIIVALTIVGMAIFAIAVITQTTVMAIIGLVLLVAATVFYALEEISGYVGGVTAWIAAAWDKMCGNMEAFFLNRIISMVESCGWLLDAINKIRKALKMDEISLGDLKTKARLAEGRGTIDTSAAFQQGFQNGQNWASNLKSKINDWGSKFQIDGVGGAFDSLGNKLGLELTNVDYPTSGLNPTSVEDLLDDVNNKLGGVGKDTGKIADSMELTEEDLKEMRKLANMDWRNEHTTAHIAVHMNNKNTINNKGDLDNWVISLRDMLTEEIDAVANGVYA